jgi:hypothetical protein
MKNNNLYLGICSVTLLLLSGCAATPSSLGLTKEHWDAASPAEKQCWMSAYGNYKQQHLILPGDVGGDNNIKISISGGTATFPPNFAPLNYQRVSDSLPNGACHVENVYAATSKAQTKLYICYAKNTVAIDPSRYDISTTDGSLILTDNPMWDEGFVYSNMNTSGYVKFSDVTIKIQRHGYK